jgi:hypothetical protein
VVNSQNAFRPTQKERETLKRKTTVFLALLLASTIAAAFAGDRRKQRAPGRATSAADLATAQKLAQAATDQFWTTYNAQMARDCPSPPQWRNVREFDLISDSEFVCRAIPHVEPNDPNRAAKLALIDAQWQAHLLKYPRIREIHGRKADAQP